jgi:hypothetical protein
MTDRPAEARTPGCTTAKLLLAAALALTGGCATRSDDVAAKAADPSTYAAWGCERLFEESDAVQQRAADVAYAVDSRAGNNMIALGLGVTVFWPALLAMRPDGLEAEQLAELKGRYEAMQVAARRQQCGPAPEGMAAKRQATLPVVVGDRLVYEERTGTAQTLHALVMQVAVLRRDQIEFQIQLDGQLQPAAWRQDLVGNPVAAQRGPLVGWRRLLKPDLTLGQVLEGDLVAAGETHSNARVRGQVVATGPQTVAGRSFDVAVIELFGDVPLARTAAGDIAQGSTRLDGVMAIDRHSGVLLRLELRSANGDFVLRRRLQRVEAAAR